MKYLKYLLIAALFAGCSERELMQPDDNGGKPNETESEDRPNDDPQIAEIPEGYFEVVFTAPASTRAPIDGSDSRIQDLKYMVFKSTGEFVKERLIVKPGSGAISWPLPEVRDTLPKGSYKAVFLGNCETTLFPYATQGNAENFADVLSGYEAGYSAARITLPPAEFADNSEYYMANVTFSDASPKPYIELHRIISRVSMHRNLVDAQAALKSLVDNIIEQLKAGNIVENQIRSILPGLIRPILDQGSIYVIPLGEVDFYYLVGGLDEAVNLVVDELVAPLADVLYPLLLDPLTSQLGAALTANTDQEGDLLGLVGALVNPWNVSNANAAIVTIDGFPKSIDFDLAVKEYFPDGSNFVSTFPENGLYEQKNVIVNSFSEEFVINEIKIVSGGLISGLVVDVVDGGLLLNGTFVNIATPLAVDTEANRMYGYNYSFLDLGLESYDIQTDGAQGLTVSTQLGNVAGGLGNVLQGIQGLGPIISPILSKILTPLNNLQITLPINVPLLGIDNLSLSGEWKEEEPKQG
jgi:hypothetical protein